MPDQFQDHGLIDLALASYGRDYKFKLNTNIVIKVNYLKKKH